MSLPCTSAGPLARPLEELVLALQGNGRSHIAFAIAADEIVRAEAMAELAERLSGRYAFYEFDYTDAPMESLGRYCRTLPQDRPRLVFAYGLEALAEKDATAYETALYFLNMHREDIRYTGSSVVLWLDTERLQDLHEKAPDFADWRQASATFELPEGERCERTPLGRLPISEAESLRDQIRRFDEMLEQPALSPSLRQEFEQQKSAAESRLGRVPDIARDYRLFLIDEYQNLVLRGLAPQVGGRVLSLPLRDVFLPLQALEGRPAVAEYAEEDLRRQAEMEVEGQMDWYQRQAELEKAQARLRARESGQRPVALADLLAAKRAVLLGDPGSGKTTVTQYVTWALATGDPTHVGEGVLGLVPVLVRFANYGRSLENALADDDGDLELLSYIEQELFRRRDFGEHVAAAIREGRSLVVLDGLDEVTDPELRFEVTRRIQDFVVKYGGNRFLVTSRIIGYDRSPLTRDFKHATLQALQLDDQKRFVELWMRAIHAKSSDSDDFDDASSLVDDLEKKRQIARMAANPLLLTIMVLMHRRGTRLPSRRVQVYQNATDTLIEYWTARRSKNRIELDAEEIKQILAPVAHHILSTNVGGVIARNDLLPLLHEGIMEQRGCHEAEVDEIGRSLLETLSEQSGLFLERGLGIDGEPVYGFLHQTFGEYLGALHMASLVLEEKFELARYIHRGAWHEPLLLLAGHLSLISPIHANRLLRSILDFPAPYEDVLRRNVILTAECLADDIQIKPALRDEVLDKLVKLFQSKVKKLVSIAVAQLELLAGTRHRDAAVRAVRQIVGNLGAKISASGEPRRSVIKALIFLRDRDTALPLFDDLSGCDMSLRVEGWPEDALDLILDRPGISLTVGQDLNNCFVEEMAVSRLVRLLGRPRLRNLLSRLFERYGDSDLRWIIALVAEPPALGIMLELLEPEIPPQVRRLAATHLLGTEYRPTAISALQALYKEEPSEMANAASALLEAGLDPQLDWKPLADEVAMFWSGRPPKAISTLFRAGRPEIAISASILSLTSGPVWKCGHVVETLFNEGQAKLATAAAQWLALHPRYRFRLWVCERLLENGCVEEAVPILKHIALNSYDDSDIQACRKLLTLRDVDVAVAILGNAEVADSDRYYEASLALALAHGSAEADLTVDEQKRSLREGARSEREDLYRKARRKLIDLCTETLEDIGIVDDYEVAFKSLAAISISIFSGKDHIEIEYSRGSSAVDNSLHALQLTSAYLDLTLGAISKAKTIVNGLWGQATQNFTAPAQEGILWLARRFPIFRSEAAVVDLFRSQSFAIRRAALRASEGAKQAEQTIIRSAISRDDKIVLSDIIEQPDGFHSLNLVQVMRLVLESKDPLVRHNAIFSLRHLKLDRFPEFINLALDGDDWDMRLQVAAFVGNRRSENLGPLRDKARCLIEEALRSRGVDDRRKAIQALWGYRYSEAREIFEMALYDEDEYVRSDALFAMSHQVDHAAFEALKKVLNDRSGEVRSGAAIALGKISIPGIVEPLQACLADSDADVRSAAVSALSCVKTPAALKAILSALEDSEDSVRRSVPGALRDFQCPSAIAALERSLRDRAVSVRSAAAWNLRHFEPSEVIDLFKWTLDDENAEVRRSAARSLGEVHNVAALKLLVEALEDPDHLVRNISAGALARRGNVSGLDVLIAALADDSVAERRAAMKGLKSLRLPETVPVICSLLTDNDEGLRRVTIEALKYFEITPGICRSLRLVIDIEPSAALLLGKSDRTAAIRALAGFFVRDGALADTPAFARLRAHEMLPLLLAGAMPYPSHIATLIHLDPAAALSVMDRFDYRIHDENWYERLRGLALLWQGQEGEALVHLRKAVKTEPPTASMTLAHFYIEKEELNEASTQIERALDSENPHPVAILSSAVVHWLQGDKQKALVELEDARWLDPVVTVAEDLRYDHFWREKALAAVEDMLRHAAAPVGDSPSDARPGL